MKPFRETLAMTCRTSLTGALPIASLIIGASVAQAGTTGTWNATSGGDWLTGGTWSSNWTTASNGAPGDFALLEGAITAASIINLNGAVTLQEIRFNNTNSYTVSGSNTITLDHVANGGLLNGSTVIRVSNGNHTISSNIALNDVTTVWTSNVNATLTINGVISKFDSTNRNLTKRSSGVLVLTNTNTYGGTTFVQSFSNEYSVLRADDGVGLSGNFLAIQNNNASVSNAYAFLETHGSFTRGLGGSGNGNVSVTSSSNNANNVTFTGFSAHGGDLTVGLRVGAINVAPLTWGSTSGFLTTASGGNAGLGLNSIHADSDVVFQNAINLNGASRRIYVGAQTATLSGALTGAAGSSLTKSGDGTLRFTNAVTYAGDTTVNAGSLVLAQTGQMTFFIGADGVNNAVLGTGAVTLDGAFNFDLTNASATLGDSWTIVDVAGLTEAFGAAFSVVGFDDAGGGLWTKAIDEDALYAFSKTTGTLSVVAVPEPASLGLMGLAGLLFVSNRRRST